MWDGAFEAVGSLTIEELLGSDAALPGVRAARGTPMATTPAVTPAMTVNTTVATNQRGPRLGATSRGVGAETSVEAGTTSVGAGMSSVGVSE